MKKLLYLVPLLALFACSDSSSSGGGASAVAGVDLLLTDAPADDLLYLRADVLGVELYQADASTTGNLLSSPVTVNLLALDGLFEWLVAGDLPVGTYTGARVEFDGLGFEAAAADGTPVTLTLTSSILDVPFAVPYDAEAGGYVRVEVDFDLLESLEGDVGSGSLTVTPTGSAVTSIGDEGIEIDEIGGTIVAFDALESTLTVDAFADGDQTVALGEIEVGVSLATLLLADDGAPFASIADFFAALTADLSLVEVHGTLAAGEIVATKIELEDLPGSGTDIIAEIRGIVTGYTPDDSFELLIQEIAEGEAEVLEVLTLLGEESKIEVGIEDGTLFFLDDDQVVTEASLAVGQVVEVEFQAFATEPFPAYKVEIEDEFPEFEGVISDISSLPDDFTILLKAGQPALLSGDVESAKTGVVVTIDQSTIELDVEGEPMLFPQDLLEGLEVVIQGTLGGTPESPTLTATDIDVIPGRLVGAVLSDVFAATKGSSSFTTFGGEVEDPFGAGTTAGPMEAFIEPECVFEGDAATEAEFLALTGIVELDVYGLGFGKQGLIRAFVVKTEVVEEEEEEIE